MGRRYRYAFGIRNDAFVAIAGVRELTESFLVLCILATAVEGEDEWDGVVVVVRGRDV